MKKLFSLLLFIFIFSSAHSQLEVTKLIGKNTDRYKLGYGVFTGYELPLNSEGYYKSIRLELMDLAFYPGKDGNFFTATYGVGYLSIKLGYKLILSETKTGFYIEPSAGYAAVSISESGEDAIKKNGFAAALEGGYSLGLGESENAVILGLKFETDRAGKDYTLNSLAFKVALQYSLFKRKNN